MTTPRLMFLLCVVGPVLAGRERPPMGVTNSRTLEHYKERLERAIKAASLRGRIATLTKLHTIRRLADELTPEQFGRLKHVATHLAPRR